MQRELAGDTGLFKSREDNDRRGRLRRFVATVTNMSKQKSGWHCFPVRALRSLIAGSGKYLCSPWCFVAPPPYQRGQISGAVTQRAIATKYTTKEEGIAGHFLFIRQLDTYVIHFYLEVGKYDL